MGVYVDDMKAKHGRLIMCHMLADTEEELLRMARLIGVNTKWHQYPGTVKSHFDICQSMRAKAVEAGAIQMTMKDTGRMIKARRAQEQEQTA